MSACLSLVVPPPVVERHVDEYLDRAEVALDAKFFAECGACLREAVRRMLFCVFEYTGTPMPRRKVKRTTGELAVLLKKAGVFNEDVTALTLDDLEVANRAAHCSFVTREQLREALRTRRWECGAWREQMPGVF